MPISKKAVFDQFDLFPPTRYMGSKEKLVPYLYDIFVNLNFKSAVDLMSGTGAVSYLFKCMGKETISNDYMNMNYLAAKCLIENSTIRLDHSFAETLVRKNQTSNFISKKFEGLYFDKNNCKMIDNINNNIQLLNDSVQKFIAQTALIRACIKKRHRGIFAYTGLNHDDGRKDLRLSINEHFIQNVDIINKAIFDNKKNNKVFMKNCVEVLYTPDLVYIDPPYFSTLSDNEYVRRYHFVEGLSRNWKGIQFQEGTKTKKFKSYPSQFSKLSTATDVFDLLIKKYAESDIIISYSSNAKPDKLFFLQKLKKYKRYADMVSVNYRYSFSNQGFAKNRIKNEVREYIFIGTNR